MTTYGKYITDNALLRWARDCPDDRVTVEYESWHGDGVLICIIKDYPASRLSWFMENRYGVLSITTDL